MAGRKSKPKKQALPALEFIGFSAPNYTQVPDELFDILMPHLKEAELKVVLYIIRRTFGFKKSSDDISINQLVDGIVTKDGRVLDSGTGLHRDSVIKALTELVKKKIIIKQKNMSKEFGNQPNTYALNIVGLQAVKDEKQLKNVRNPEVDPSRKIPTRGGRKIPTSPSRKIPTSPSSEFSAIQETDVQHTVVQETVTTTTRAPGTHDVSVVVAFLTSRGMSTRIAQKLATTQDEALIREKVEYLDFLLEEDPERVKNPTGWLRRAIEEDYAAPDGFVSQAERDEQEAHMEAERQRHDELARIQEERHRIFKGRELQAYQDFRDRLTQEYGTTEEDLVAWETVRSGVKLMLGTVYLTHFADAEVLTVRDDLVVVGLKNAHSVEAMSRRGNKIKVELEVKTVFGRNMPVEFVVIGKPETVSIDLITVNGNEAECVDSGLKIGTQNE